TSSAWTTTTSPAPPWPASSWRSPPSPNGRRTTEQPSRKSSASSPTAGSPPAATKHPEAYEAVAGLAHLAFPPAASTVGAGGNHIAAAYSSRVPVRAPLFGARRLELPRSPGLPRLGEQDAQAA